MMTLTVVEMGLMFDLGVKMFYTAIGVGGIWLKLSQRHLYTCKLLDMSNPEV